MTLVAGRFSGMDHATFRTIHSGTASSNISIHNPDATHLPISEPSKRDIFAQHYRCRMEDQTNESIHVQPEIRSVVILPPQLVRVRVHEKRSYQSGRNGER